jgi:para-aminobenzoate synthetase component 1
MQPHSQECLVAAGCATSLDGDGSASLERLQSFISANKNKWLFGHINYDLKNELEQLTSNHRDPVNFPQLFFFEPAIVLHLNETDLKIEAEDPAAVYNLINGIHVNDEQLLPAPLFKVQQRLQKADYISIVQKLQQHILRGDCYEINFCQEFFAEDVELDPFYIYKKLSDISPNPFSALYRLRDKWLLCASPERFIKREGSKIMAQPIKGTAGRMPGNKALDEQLKMHLQHSDKDRSENVMIVDLMRNDLSKVCEEGTVKVDELYGIYSFPQVHQMISTISGELKAGIEFPDIIRATFPMGSMTGAPKKRVMELIEEYESTRRGIFSGTVGYISPVGDFDFNVIIRSIMYNTSSRYLSFQTGSAITFYSDPEKEWEECLLKADALKQCLL